MYSQHSEIGIVILKGKVGRLWVFFMSEMSEKIHNSTKYFSIEFGKIGFVDSVGKHAEE